MTQLGVIGLGTMGANLARNAARNGAEVIVFNRTKEKTDEFMKSFQKEGTFIAVDSIEQLVSTMKAPRNILLMVKAGDAVDDMIHDLTPLLAKGDVIIDAGNSHYKDSQRREKILIEKGLRFVGMGVSGGEEGALNGPSMMPGGDKEAYEKLSSLLIAMSADDGGKGKCVSYVGPGGAGHFVKMVHNGIEYGIMQLLAETYHVLKELGGCTNAELAEIFGKWNTTKYLRSFLIEITASIFTKKDDDTKNDLVDVILDKAGQKGTGKWTTDAAMNYGVAIPLITSAVDARIISGMKEFRVQRNKEVGCTPLSTISIPSKAELISILQPALEQAMSAAYAEGFLLMSTANKEEGWNLNLSEIARIWRGGCIIRSGTVELFQMMAAGDKKAYEELMNFATPERQKSLRTVSTIAIANGIPVPAFNAAITSYDAYRTARLPQNLIQAQRDFFGAHTFERTDKAGTFHANWNG